MILHLARLPALYLERGIYGVSKTRLGEKQTWAHPDLAACLASVEASGLRLFFSDVYRSPEGSRDARRKKSGVQPAGYSAHNVGLAVDIDVERVLKGSGYTKHALDSALEAHGLYCHRRDSRRGSEDWHFNALAPDPAQWQPEGGQSTAAAVERKIQAIYGGEMRLTPAGVQAALGHLGFWKPSVVGVDAILAFQTAWDLVADGVAGERTQRTLAFAAATRG